MKIINHCGVFLIFIGLIAAAPYVLLLLQELTPTKVLLAPIGISTVGAIMFLSTWRRLKHRDDERDFQTSRTESVAAKQQREVETWSQMY